MSLFSAKFVFLHGQTQSPMARYIYQHENWTDFTWDYQKISNLLAEVRNLQGRLLGKMASLGFQYQNEATLENITLDIRLK